MYPQVVNVVRTGQRGRPQKIPNEAFLREAMASGRGIKITKLAKVIGVHRNTLTRYLKKYKIDYQHSGITDDELDTSVREFREEKPNSGIRYTTGYLRTLGYRIQRDRITASLRRIDPLGQVLRHQTTIRRRQYRVPRPNALWHIDGHHKLIRWGVVIHGAADGYCRTVR